MKAISSSMRRLFPACLVAMGTLCSGRSASAQTGNETTPNPARAEKAAMEEAFGESLDEDFRVFIHQRGETASFIDWSYDQLRHQRKKGIILAGVVSPGLAALTSGLILWNTLTSTDGIGMGIGNTIFGFGGGLLTLSFLVPGIVMIAISRCRLKRMAHLRDVQF